MVSDPITRIRFSVMRDARDSITYGLTEHTILGDDHTVFISGDRALVGEVVGAEITRAFSSKLRAVRPEVLAQVRDRIDAAAAGARVGSLVFHYEESTQLVPA